MRCLNKNRFFALSFFGGCLGLAVYLLSSCGLSTDVNKTTLHANNVLAISGPGQVTLSWDESLTNFSNFKVSVGTSSGVYSKDYKNIKSPYLISDLKDNTQYYFLVSATNSSGQISNIELTAKTFGVFENLSLSSEATSITLTWPQEASVTYALSRGSSVGGKYTVLSDDAKSPYKDEGLSSGTQYYYLLIATSSSISSYAKALAIPAEPPVVTTTSTIVSTPPGSFSISSIVAGDSSATISWGESTGATSYAIYRSTKSGGPYVQIPVTETDSHKDTGLVNGVTYYYVVSASNGKAETWTTESSVTPLNAPQKFYFSSISSANQQLVISWNPSQFATSYTLSRNGTVIQTTTDTTYTDLGLTNGQSYTYTVTADNPQGSLAVEAPISGTPNFRLIAVSNNQQVSLTWDVSANDMGYTLLKGTSFGNYPTTLASNLNVGTYVDSNVVFGTQYFYKLVPNNPNLTAYATADDTPEASQACVTWVRNYVAWMNNSPTNAQNTCPTFTDPDHSGVSYIYEASNGYPRVTGSIANPPLVYLFFCRSTVVTCNGGCFYNAVTGSYPLANATAPPANCPLPNPPVGFPAFN